MSRDINRPDQRQARARLRRDMTVPETILWSRLQRSQLHGLKFRRQHGLGPYVVDFYCPRLRLAVEIDGDSHFEMPEAEAYDLERTAYLERQGVAVLRFTNRQIGAELEAVLVVIAEQAAIRAGDGVRYWSDRDDEGSRPPTTP